MASGKGSSVVIDGPTLVLLNKRIRNLRKKLRRIAHLEDSIAHGKSIIKNKDQESLLKSKPTIIAAVNELEKFRQPLSVAVDEEITLALQRRHNDNDEDINKAQKFLDTEQHGTEPPALPLDDLPSLIYIGRIFDVMLHERNRGLLYEFLTNDSDSSVILTNRDLDMMSLLRSLLISRPVGSSLFHQNALQRFIEHADLWLSKSEQQIVPNSDITDADLREKLTKIMGLEYSINPPADDVVAAVARKSLCLKGSVTQCEEKGTTHHESSTETDEDNAPVFEGTKHHESSTESDEDNSPLFKQDYVAPREIGKTVEYQSDHDPDEDKFPVFEEEMLKPENWCSDYEEEEQEGWQPYQCWLGINNGCRRTALSSWPRGENTFLDQLLFWGLSSDYDYDYNGDPDDY